MSIGIYVRPWNADFYLNLARGVFPEESAVLLSEFKHGRHLWLGKSLYAYRQNSKAVFTTKEKLDIYLRCRFLRTRMVEEAFEMIDRMSSYVAELFSEHRFKYFVGHLIDNYTLDIIERICQKEGVPYISLVGHFINGYMRISTRGELNVVRDSVDDEEISEVVSQLTEESYKPNFKLNKERTKLSGIYNYYRSTFKNIYFYFRKVSDNDELNYHYNTLHKIRLRDVMGKNADSLFTRIDELSFDKNCVYVPLHYTPEATVDYWCDRAECALYEDSLAEAISHSSKDIAFILKEHPAMYMRRSRRFYSRLLGLGNVRIVHPYESSNSILQKVDNVLVHTGSVGVEALLRGKKVFCVTENYYARMHPNAKTCLALTRQSLSREAVRYDNHRFVGELLSGLIPARFENDKNIRNSDVDKIVRYLKDYVYRIISESKGKVEM